MSTNETLARELAWLNAEWEMYQARVRRYNLFVRTPSSLVSGLALGWVLTQLWGGDMFWLMVGALVLLFISQFSAPIPKPLLRKKAEKSHP